MTKLHDKLFEPINLVDKTGGMTPDQIGGVLSTSSSAAGQLISKLDDDKYDCCVFVFSDSTGNSQTEWVYLYSQWLASLYPAYSVEYYLWDDDNDVYFSGVDIQTGTGSNTLRIYNGAVPGSRPAHLLGEKYPSAVLAIPDADLIICNHGHNFLSYHGADESNIYSGRVPIFLEAFSQILCRHDGAGVIMLTQNPLRDSDDYAPQYIAIKNTAGLINADVADSYVGFVEANKDSSLYIDNIHPSDQGTAIYLNAIKTCHNSRIHKAAYNPVSKSSRNLLSNGNFNLFDSSLPDDWTGSNATASKDTTIFESDSGYSVSLSKTTPGSQSYLTQNLTTNQKQSLRGCYLTFAVRIYVPSGQSGTVGRVALMTNSKSSNNYPVVSDAVDGWSWRMISVYFSPSDSYLFARIYIDSGTSEDTANIKIDRAILCRGRIPSDI